MPHCEVGHCCLQQTIRIVSYKRFKYNKLTLTIMATLKETAEISVTIGATEFGSVSFELMLKKVTDKSIVLYKSTSMYEEYLNVEDGNLLDQYVFNLETGKGRGRCAKSSIDKEVLVKLKKRYKPGVCVELDQMEVNTGIGVKLTRIYNKDSKESYAEWAAEAACS